MNRSESEALDRHITGDGEAEAIVAPLVDELLTGIDGFMEEASELDCICSCHHIGLSGRAHMDVCEVMCV